MIMIMMGLPIAIVLAWMFDIDRSNDKGNTIIRTEAAPSGHQSDKPPIVSAAYASVAVLPFENLSPDKGNQYLADGIAAELHTILVNMHRLRVISRTSAASFVGENVK